MVGNAATVCACGTVDDFMDKCIFYKYDSEKDNTRDGVFCAWNAYRNSEQDDAAFNIFKNMWFVKLYKDDTSEASHYANARKLRCYNNPWVATDKSKNLTEFLAETFDLYHIIRAVIIFEAVQVIILFDVIGYIKWRTNPFPDKSMTQKVNF